MSTTEATTAPDRRPLDDDVAGETLKCLHVRLDSIESAVHASAVWNILCAAETAIPQAVAILREIMWSVAAYQAHTTEAGFRMLGRLPKAESKLLMSLAHHKAEEAAHGEWAKRDFLLLGGDPARLEAPLSTATFAVAATWDRMADVEDPFGYLGAEYLFEALTLRLVPTLVRTLQLRGFPLERADFVVEHATEDVKHTNLIVHWLLDTISARPRTADSVVRCFDYFAAVYPLPVWTEALHRAVPASHR